MEIDSKDYVIRVHADPLTLNIRAWNALLEASPEPTPFMRLDYLQELHASGSACAETGWQPLFLTVSDREALVAACPAYLKTHSYGEYVFDWAWADAYARHGLDYYPKLLVAVPFTPVPGSRLLARDAEHRALLAQALLALAQQQGLSSAHVLFGERADTLGKEWMQRRGVQFHWRNQGDSNWLEFLATLQRDKRKKIQQEQRRVRDAGIGFEVLQGTQISAADWDFFHHCYTLTYQAHRSTPYLTRDFFARMGEHMTEHWLMFIAQRGEERVAASLIALDPVRRHAFGRYWGAVEPIDCLHFDACYYQPLAWCIAQGYRRFEGGAQGEHKMARGLMPTPTGSAHWLARPDFRDAVGDFLAREGEAMRSYVNELELHQPFKAK